MSFLKPFFIVFFITLTSEGIQTIQSEPSPQCSDPDTFHWVFAIDQTRLMCSGNEQRWKKFQQFMKSPQGLMSKIPPSDFLSLYTFTHAPFQPEIFKHRSVSNQTKTIDQGDEVVESTSLEGAISKAINMISSAYMNQNTCFIIIMDGWGAYPSQSAASFSGLLNKILANGCKVCIKCYSIKNSSLKSHYSYFNGPFMKNIIDFCFQHGADINFLGEQVFQTQIEKELIRLKQEDQEQGRKYQIQYPFYSFAIR